MPALGWSVRMVWQDGAQGIGETYYWNGPGDDPVAVVYPAALALYKARTAMMGQAIIPVSFRISQLGAFRSYVNSNPADIAAAAVGPFLLNVSLNAAQVAAGISNAQDGSAGQAPDAVVMNAFSGPANHSRKFLGGVPDVLERTNPLGPWIVGVPSWLSLFNAFVNLLLSGSLKWAFRARTPPTVAPWAPVAVQSVALDPAGTGFWGVLVPTFSAPVAVGSVIQLRKFRMNSTAFINFNGSYQVDSIVAGAPPGTSFYYLRGTQKVAGAQVAFKGTAQGVDFSLFPYRSVTVGKQTTHKRGNRFLASPGRRKVIQRLTS